MPCHCSRVPSTATTSAHRDRVTSVWWWELSLFTRRPHVTPVTSSSSACDCWTEVGPYVPQGPKSSCLLSLVTTSWEGRLEPLL